jgi:hypothetical protein
MMTNLGPQTAIRPRLVSGLLITTLHHPQLTYQMQINLHIQETPLNLDKEDSFWSFSFLIKTILFSKPYAEHGGFSFFLLEWL